MRELRIRRTKDSLHVLRVGCSFDVLTKRSSHSQSGTSRRADDGSLPALRESSMGLCEQSGRLTKPLIPRRRKFREASWDEALDLVARKFREIKAKTDRIAGVCLFF